MNLRPYSAILLSSAGLILAGMGLYFTFLRPNLLPEDLRYMGSTLQNIQKATPGLLNWLQKVFWVMGGYIFATGLLTIYISLTSFRIHQQGAFITVALAGVTSIGLMSVVNFMIGSDFKWLLSSFALLWIAALVLYRFHL